MDELVDQKQQKAIDELLKLARRNRVVDIAQWVAIGFIISMYVLGHALL